MLSGNDYGEWKLETGNWKLGTGCQKAKCNLRITAVSYCPGSLLMLVHAFSDASCSAPFME